MKAGQGTGAGIGLVQVDDACPVPAWGEVDHDGQWRWKTSDDALLWLQQGRHTLRFLSAAGSVNLDRIVLTADEDCVPDFPTEDCTVSAPAL